MKKYTQLKIALIGAILAASTSVFAQVKIGTNPTTIEAASNLEVEASTAGRKVKVDKTTGQLTIKDGTEGTAKILTSDADGGASWQAPASNLRLLGDIVAETFPVAFAVEKKINVTPTMGTQMANWDAVNRKLVITKAGVYRTVASVGIQGTSTTVSSCLLVLRGGVGSVDTFTASSSFVTAKSLIVTSFCPVGTEITLSFQINAGAPVQVTGGRLSVEEIP